MGEQYSQERRAVAVCRDNMSAGSDSDLHRRAGPTSHDVVGWGSGFPVKGVHRELVQENVAGKATCSLRIGRQPDDAATSGIALDFSGATG